MLKRLQSPFARRSFLSRLGIGLAGGAALGGGASSASAQTNGGTAWQPARHPADDWLDHIPGKHRFVFDAITADGITLAATFINNYLNANQSGYGLTDKDLAVVLILRHRATPFSYNNGIWSKHGTPITSRTEYNDPATNKPPAVNLFAERLNGLIERGIHIAVCGVSTRNYARTIAAAGGGTEDEVFQLLGNSLLKNARIVPAGIITVNRAQEHGYSLAYTG